MKGPALAVLMAGGKSRRMGRDKATLQWAGRSLWEHQVAKLSALNPERIAVAAPVRPGWLPDGIEWLPDVDPDTGPLGGVLAGLESIQDGHMLVLAVDLPAMTPDYLSSLFSAASAGVGVVPQGEYGFEPLAAVYPAEARESAEQWFASGQRGLQGWVRSLAGESLIRLIDASPDALLFRNLNCPEDL